MKLFELISKIPQPDMIVYIYDNDVNLLIRDTIFKLHINLKKLQNKRIKILHPIDYLLKYSNVKYIQTYVNYLDITLEDKIKEY